MVTTLICAAAALSACSAGGMSPSGPSQGLTFVASNSDSVLLDYPPGRPDLLAAAYQTATQQCQFFNKRAAVLESLILGDRGVIRATYLCQNGYQTSGLR